MIFLDAVNNILVLLDTYKLQILFVLTILDSFIVWLISKNKYRKKLNRYIKFHINYGVGRINLIKISLSGLFLFLIGEPILRGAAPFALVFIYVGLIIMNIQMLLSKDV